MPQTRFHSLLRERILKEVESYSESLANGGAKDYPHYRDTVGYVRGLKAALTLCEEIEKDFD